MANYHGKYPLLDTVFQGTTTLSELKPEFSRLFHLNEKLPKIAPHISTLSYGENLSTCISSSYTCFHIVKDDSANPGYYGKYLDTNIRSFIYLNIEIFLFWFLKIYSIPYSELIGPNHAFFKLEANHRGVCKPESRESDAYQQVIRFIKDLKDGNPPSFVPVPHFGGKTEVASVKEIITLSDISEHGNINI